MLLVDCYKYVIIISIHNFSPSDENLGFLMKKDREVSHFFFVFPADMFSVSLEAVKVTP